MLKPNSKMTKEDLDKQNTENKILEAAKRVFIRKGLNGARMQEIADEAEINKSLLHYYYRSKEKLFTAVFNMAFKLLLPQFIKLIMNDEISIFDKIRLFFKNHMTFLHKNPYLPEFILHEISQNPKRLANLIGEKASIAIEILEKQIKDEVEKGIIKEVSAKELLINLLSLSVFQFAASPLIKIIMNFSDEEFNDLIEERKTNLAEFVINSIKKQ